MALNKTAQQIGWNGDGSRSKSLLASSTGTSDAAAIGATVVDGSVQLKAEHSGTPGSGDTVEFYALYSNGDPDGDEVADEFDTTEQGTLLAVLDLNEDDPAITTVPLPIVAAKALKVYAVNNAGEDVTVSAQLYVMTST